MGEAEVSGGAVRLCNLTPHEVVLEVGEGEPLRLPPAGIVPRLLLSEGRQEVLRVAVPDASDSASPEEPAAAAPAADASGSVGAVADVPLAVGVSWLGLDPPLPDPRPDVVYVTSRVVAEHFPCRTDLVWPDGLVRDVAGTVVAASCLARLVDMDESDEQVQDCLSNREEE